MSLSNSIAAEVDFLSGDWETDSFILLLYRSKHFPCFLVSLSAVALEIITGTNYFTIYPISYYFRKGKQVFKASVSKHSISAQGTEVEAAAPRGRRWTMFHNTDEIQ